MSDLISRQAAIDALNDEFTITGKTNAIAVQDYIRRVNNRLRGLPSAQPEQRWVSVSEQLPEESGEYLVTYHPCYWDDVESEILVGIDTFRGKTTWAKRKYQRVIAWMPLPEPYRPEGGEADV